MYKTARLWDRNGNQLAVFEHEAWVYNAVFSPDGRYILTVEGEDITSAPGGDKTARLWDRNGNQLAVFRGHEDYVGSVVFSPNGRQILTASFDKTARLWDVSPAIAAQAEQLAALQTSEEVVFEVDRELESGRLQLGGESINVIQLARWESRKSKEAMILKLEKDVELHLKAGKPAKAAIRLLFIGNIQANLGEFQKALDSYNQGLSLSQQAGAKAVEAAILNSLGELYNNLADHDAALGQYNKALPILYQLNDKEGAATTLNNIGNIDVAIGNTKDALQSYNKALTISRAGADLAQEAKVLTNISSLYMASEDWKTALLGYKQALSISRNLNDKLKEASILNQMGKIQAALGQQDTAKESYNQALILSRQLGFPTEEANILYHQAILNRQQNNLTAAKTDIEAAIAIIESLRTKIASPKLRQNYFATQYAAYQFYIDLLMELHEKNPSKGYDAQGFHASESSRARGLIELLIEANANIREGVEPELLEQEQNLEFELDAIEKQRVELLSSSYTNQEKEEIESKRKALLQAYQEIKDKIRATSPRYAALKYPTPLTLQEVQEQVLDEDTLLLQYSLGEKRSFLWAVTKDGMTSYELPSRKEIEKIARSFYKLSQNRDFNFEMRGGIGVKPIELATASVTEISKILLGEVAPKLNNKRILVVGDGILEYIPFAAIPTPDTAKTDNPIPLIKDYEIVNSPSSSTIAIIRNEAKDKQIASNKLAIFADPVFSSDDGRVKNGKTNNNQNLQEELSLLTQRALDLSMGQVDVGVWNRLPGTRKEAETILNLIPDENKISAFDFDANIIQATSKELSDYSIIHFATHGLLNPKNPELSGIIFSLVDDKGESQNGFLRLNDIFNLKLPSADLVVLSACQTGLGEEVKGEGLVGLTRGFMYAGSPRVLVSLWSVSDKATAEIMSRFYRLMWEEGLTPTQALRAAQIEMQTETQWKSPYYWAAFTIQGEWR
ncbi:MAG: CHAT domain-containing protein [Moorea sp. SIO2B7]|nr:CHAT domain-containing protein [Moorena sp. SIO2B7]